MQELKAHYKLCEEVLALVTKENQELNTPGEYSNCKNSLHRKNLLPALSESLERLRKIRAEWLKATPAERARCQPISGMIQASQDLLMKIIMLDRENEQAMLRRGLVPAHHLPPANRNRPHYVTALYQRNKL